MLKTHVYRFWTDYRTDYIPDPNDPEKKVEKITPIDYVEFGPPGAADRNKTQDKVSRLLKTIKREPTSLNRAMHESNDLADHIRPLYEAWKNGQELPETGTPLAAWNVITPELAEIFKTRSIKTVEEIAELTDSGMQRVPMPGIRKLVDQAKLFLKSKDQRAVASDLAKKDAEISALKTQMDELMSFLKANDKTGGLEPLLPVKRKPGRPPKAKAA